MTTTPLSKAQLAAQLRPFYNPDLDWSEQEAPDERWLKFWVFEKDGKTTDVYVRNRPLEEYPIRDLESACKDLGLPIVQNKKHLNAIHNKLWQLKQQQQKQLKK